MLVSLNDVTKYTAKATDLSAPVEDVFVDQNDWSVNYVSIDIGGWFENKSAIIAADRVRAIDAERRDIQISLTEAEAADAPDLDSGDGIEPAKAGLMLDYKDKRGSRPPAGATANPSATRYVSVAHTVGLDAYKGETQVGRIVDLLMDPENLTVSHVVIDTGTTLAKTQKVIPVSTLDHIDIAKGRAVVSATQKQIEDGPALESYERLDRNWMDRVAAYYGLTG
ncbi:hypothetical protein [Oceanibium sediminis]|uniref:hypothetical protein n=1 Tax=Oceanibium sediminis TaxID=2026339 RepID=UPI000DD4A8A4|nr:hypothetical protein [Oceanibium sediminis]